MSSTTCSGSYTQPHRVPLEGRQTEILVGGWRLDFGGTWQSLELGHAAALLCIKKRVTREATLGLRLWLAGRLAFSQER